MSDSINLDKIVEAYAKIKDARTAKKRAWEAEDSELEASMTMLKQVMLAKLNAIGGKSVATNHGTIYRTEKIKPSAADWQVVYTWIMADPDRFEVLERRLKPTFIKQFMDDNAGAIPPGVNVHREFEVSVRRANSSSESSSFSTINE